MSLSALSSLTSNLSIFLLRTLGKNPQKKEVIILDTPSIKAIIIPMSITKIISCLPLPLTQTSSVSSHAYYKSQGHIDKKNLSYLQ